MFPAAQRRAGSDARKLGVHGGVVLWSVTPRTRLCLSQGSYAPGALLCPAVAGKQRLGVDDRDDQSLERRTPQSARAHSSSDAGTRLAVGPKWSSSRVATTEGLPGSARIGAVAF